MKKIVKEIFVVAISALCVTGFSISDIQEKGAHVAPRTAPRISPIRRSATVKKDAPVQKKSSENNQSNGGGEWIQNYFPVYSPMFMRKKSSEKNEETEKSKPGIMWPWIYEVAWPWICKLSIPAIALCLYLLMRK